MSIDKESRHHQLRVKIKAQWLTAQNNVDSLLKLPPEGQLNRLRVAHKSVRTPAVAEILLQMSHEQGFRDHQRSYELAELALRVAWRISGDDDRVGCRLATWDYQALAKAQMANACRIGCLLGQAYKLMGKAFEYLPLGTGNPRVEARLCSLRGSLYKDRRRYDLAMEDLEQARQLYAEEGLKKELAGVLVNLGTVYYHLERFQDAMTINELAMDHVDEQSQPSLAAAATCNRVAFLTELGDPATAIKCFDVSASFEQLGIHQDSTLFAFRDWELGRAYLLLRNETEAKQHLELALMCFQSKGDSYNRALTMLDLARLLMSCKSGKSSLQIAIKALGILKSQDLDDAGTRAVQQLREAAEEQLLTPIAILKVLRTLQVRGARS